MLILKLLSIAALIGSVAWFIHAPDYEPAVASITALSASIAAFVVDRKQRRETLMHQSVAGGSVGIQAGGNVSMGNVKTKNTGK
jgi:hypothetical protein